MLDEKLFEQVGRLKSASQPFCVVTIVDARGSIPQIVGARAIFSSQGLVYGTVGGGTVEATCEKKALELLAGPRLPGDDGTQPCFQRYNLQKDLGMICGGEVALFFEVQRPDFDWNIVIFGAGHIAQVLCRFLIELDCHVLCIDTRSEWLDRLPRSQKLEVRRVEEFSDGVAGMPQEAYVLVMTMGHAYDLPVLKAIEQRQIRTAHLGLIGSDAKAGRLRKQLAADGLPGEFIDGIVCPVGDKVGNNTPPQVAVGILSQLVRLRNAR